MKTKGQKLAEARKKRAKVIENKRKEMVKKRTRYV